VSHGLAVPQRTLQARLREEATGFRQLVDEVRRERGEALLADPTVALIEVAFLLGFGDQSAFTNAFRRWTGRTPAAYRRSISAVRR
jgi:AraC-like DNA-binding protein